MLADPITGLLKVHRQWCTWIWQLFVWILLYNSMMLSNWIKYITIQTSNVVFVGDTDSPQPVTCHWFNHIRYHSLLLMDRKRLDTTTLAKYMWASAKNKQHSDVSKLLHTALPIDMLTDKPIYLLFLIIFSSY